MKCSVGAPRPFDRTFYLRMRATSATTSYTHTSAATAYIVKLADLVGRRTRELVLMEISLALEK